MGITRLGLMATPSQSFTIAPKGDVVEVVSDGRFFMMFVF